MDCIYCSGKTQVVNSRPQKRLHQVWRRRKCTQCQGLFSTLERIDPTTSLLVVDKSGQITPFSRDKLFVSLLKACGHRPEALQDASGLADTVTVQLLPMVENASLKRPQIAETALQTLERFDKAAAVQYAAYHHLS